MEKFRRSPRPTVLAHFAFLALIICLGLGGILHAQGGLPALFEGSGYEAMAVPGFGTSLPGRIAARDLNGDGWPELALLDSSPQGIQLRFGGPELSFSDPVSLGAGFGYNGAELFDFDGDGWGDVVAIDSDVPSGLHVFLGDGTGGFVALGVAAGSGSGSDLALGDLDGDGLQDVVVAVFDLGVVEVYLGTGGGQVALPSSYAGIVGMVQLKLRDVDGDGRLDAITANGSAPSISVLRGDGLGGFGSPMQSSAVSPSHIDLGDLDGDGDLDLASTGGASLAVRTSQNQEGVFSAWGITSPGGPVAAVSLGHLDGDGILDAAIGYDDGSPTNFSFTEAATLLGDGTGTFQVHSQIGQSGLGDEVSEVLLVDLDLDGALDLVGSFESRNHTAIYRGLGDGGVLQNEIVHQSFGPQDVALGDFNGDGLDDLVVGNTGFMNGVKFLELALATGPGTFDQGIALCAAVDVVRTADMNEDGLLDVVYIDQTFGDTWCISLGDGLGGLGTPTCRGVGQTASHMSIVDMDGDGHLDLVGYRTVSNVMVVYGDGLGGFIGNTQSTPVAGRIGGIDVADLNGDGFLDVVAVDSANDLFTLLFNDGTGNLPFRMDVDPGVGLGGDVVVFDADRDGELDLMAEDDGFGFNTNLVLLPGLGNLTYGTVRTYRTGGILELFPVDVDRDGWTDLVTLDSSSLVIIRADGLGGFRPREFYSGGVSTAGFALADQDQDGWLDLFFANTLSTTVMAHYSKAPDFARAAVRNGSGTNPLAFSSTTAPVLGATWTSQVNASGFPGASTSLVVVYDRGLAGLPTPFGEILVAVSPFGQLLDAELQPILSGLANHSVATPSDLALIGMTVSAQAVLLGAGPTLTNAIDLAFGL